MSNERKSDGQNEVDELVNQINKQIERHLRDMGLNPDNYEWWVHSFTPTKTVEVDEINVLATLKISQAPSDTGGTRNG